jgi:hypothetical protein
LVHAGVRDQNIKIPGEADESETLPVEFGMVSQANPLPGRLDQ